jgi:transcriptional regulator with XRE-family HTH domain
MTPQQYAENVATEVRAEMGRQRKTQAELAQALGITAATAGRRLSGEVPFDLIEIAQAAVWLGVEPTRFTPSISAAGISAA